MLGLFGFFLSDRRLETIKSERDVFDNPFEQRADLGSNRTCGFEAKQENADALLVLNDRDRQCCGYAACERVLTPWL